MEPKQSNLKYEENERLSKQETIKQEKEEEKELKEEIELMDIDSENSQEFEKHLSNTTFKYEKCEYKFSELYKNFKRGNFPTDDFILDYDIDGKFYILYKGENDEIIFYFYNYLLELELFDLNLKKNKIVKICSTYEIYNIINQKNKINFYYGNKKIHNYNITPLMIKNNKISLTYYQETIEKINFANKYKFIYTKDKSFSPIIFDKYFYTYFPELDTFENINKKFQYIKTKKRQELQMFISSYLQDNNIIKFTGPSGIGKSFFLLYLSKTTNNYLYLNFAVMNYLLSTNQNIKLINLLISALNRLNLSEKNTTHLNEYFEKLTIVDIDHIVKYLINYLMEQKMPIKIILDQFKMKYFMSWEDFENDFQKKERTTKLIICSSINDNNIRDSICKNINDFISDKEERNKDKNEEKKNNEIPKKKSEYFYISNLFDKQSLNQLYNSEVGLEIKDENKFIYESFDYIPKYVLKINKANNAYIESSNIVERIKTKFRDFYKADKDADDMNLKLKLSSLRRYIGQNFPIKDFIGITSKFSFKYFIIKFYTKEGEVDFINNDMPIISFKIDYLFSLISEIIGEMALESNDLFFDNGIYKEHSGSTIGGYFELVAIEKIKKNILILPNNHYEYIINVDKINEMNKIKLNINHLIKNKIELSKEMKEIKQKENSNILENNENINIEKNITEKNIKIQENLDFTIHPSFEQSKLINFEADYLVQKSTINEIKNAFIKDNNFRIYDDSGNLFLSSRLFETPKDKIKKVLTKSLDDINNNYHLLKDKNILITQFYENAEAFDLGYLFGESDKKVFIGFHMKSYKDYCENKRTFKISREKIIKQSQMLIFNSKVHLDVDIIQLNYIIVGLYFKDEKNLKENVTYSEDLIKFCEKNKFKLILYDPFLKVFLDEKKNYIREIKMNDKNMNLLEEEEIKPYEGLENNYLKRKTNRQLEGELIELTKNTNNLHDIGDKLSLYKIMLLINQIKNELNLKKIKYAGAYKISNKKFHLYVPKENYMLLFYKKNHKEMKDLKKFYAYLQKNKKFFVYDFETKKSIQYDFNLYYYSLFELNENYYIFKIEN